MGYATSERTRVGPASPTHLFDLARRAGLVTGGTRGLVERTATANEMIGPALFLVADAASYVTGQVQIADGGPVPGR